MFPNQVVYTTIAITIKSNITIKIKKMVLIWFIGWAIFVYPSKINSLRL